MQFKNPSITARKKQELQHCHIEIKLHRTPKTFFKKKWGKKISLRLQVCASFLSSRSITRLNTSSRSIGFSPIWSHEVRDKLKKWGKYLNETLVHRKNESESKSACVKGEGELAFIHTSYMHLEPAIKLK